MSCPFRQKHTDENSTCWTGQKFHDDTSQIRQSTLLGVSVAQCLRGQSSLPGRLKELRMVGRMFPSAEGFQDV